MCPSKSKKKSPPSKASKLAPSKTSKSPPAKTSKSAPSKTAKKLPPPKTSKSSSKPTKKSPPPKTSKPPSKPTKKSPPPKVSKSTKSSAPSKSNHSKPAPSSKNIKRPVAPIRSAEKNAEREKLDQAKKRNYSEIDKAVNTLVNDKHSVLLEFLETTLELTEDETKKAIKRLEVKGKLKSERVMEGGKWMTRVEAIDNYGIDQTAQPKKNTQDFVWNTHGDLPCFLCPQTRKCGQGQESLNPEKCPDLTGWMDANLSKKEYRSRFKNQAVEDAKAPPVPPIPPGANGAVPPAGATPPTGATPPANGTTPPAVPPNTPPKK